MYARSVINTKGFSRSSDAYSLTAGVGIKNPTHDIKLSDIDGVDAGLVLCNRNGKQDPRGMSISSMPRTALQMSQGNGGYDDMLPPFVTEVQSTWIGGRAQDSLSSDRTRFYDSFRIDTTKEFPICAPKALAQTGIDTAGSTAIGSGAYYSYGSIALSSGFPFLAVYKPTAEMDITQIDIRLTAAHSGWTLYYHIGNDSQLDPATYSVADNYAYKMHFDDYLPGGTWVGLPIASTNVTVAKALYVALLAVPDEARFSGAVLAYYAPSINGGVYRSTNETSWDTIATDSFLYSVIHETVEFDVKLFEYKRQLYLVKNNIRSGTADLMMNGWRGVADTSTINTLVDATQNGWAATTEYPNGTAAGCIVLIINGTGEKEQQPWRYITSSIDHTLNLSTPWKVAPDNTTEYVVLGSDQWFDVSTKPSDTDYIGKPVTSVVVVKDYAIFAMGDSQKLSYYCVDQSSNAFREQWAADATYYADLLCPIVNENGDLKLWRADQDDCWVDCSDVPAFGGTMVFDVHAHERADLLLQQQRAVYDWDTENAKGDKDTGYLTSLERTMFDLDYQISAHTVEMETKSDGTGPNFSSPDQGVTFITTDPSVAHKYLPQKIYCGNTNARIVNILGYGQPEIPYILKEDGFGSIYNNIYQEMPIGEMATVRSEDNGQAAMQYGVYLYFNIAGGMLERYYDQRLDDIGPNRDEGLPLNRQGEIKKIIPYPGRYYAAVDAGFNGFSSVLCNNMLGWHEIYRSNVMGARINDIYIQSIPGNQFVDRLWVSEATSVVALPISISPLQQYKYPYYGYRDVDKSGYIETSWIDFNLKDVEKYFHSVTVFSDYSGDVKTGNEYEINVWFRVDGDTSWSYAGRAKASELIDGKRHVGVKEIELRYYSPIRETPHNVSGKKIKFKVALTPMADEYETPRLKALLINAVLRMPIKRSWNVTFMLEPMKDLQDRPLTDTPALLYNQLYTWANSKTHATPLLMRTNDAVTDNKYVFIDPASISPFQALSQMGDGSAQKEYRHIATMTIYEV
jgi:hypothetical protein